MGCLGWLSGFAQEPPKPFGSLPTQRQLDWHEMEMYGLIHFGLNTYQDKEWGYGDADPKLFNPAQFDAEQIVLAAKAGGLNGLILVAKHHDGFCLWPTKTTDYNITKSPWRGGQGDLVKEFAQACEKHGLRFGLYNSPWDRNNKDYGKPAYLDTYRAQWRELYTGYGDLFASWHDGANGGDGYYGGAKETRKIDRTTYYDWEKTWLTLTRRLQPGAVIFSDIGPDIRWVGNEKGIAAETHWATFTPAAPDGKGQPAPGYANDKESPMGHRDGRHWIPAECDVPLRPGWFYHANQDARVKTRAEMLDIYFKSVGRGANLDWGLAPDTRGLLHENDVKALQAFGDALRQMLANNLAAGATVTASNIRGDIESLYDPSRLLDGDRYSYWATDDDVTTAEVTFDLKQSQSFNVVRLRENIMIGQRIEGFAVDAWQNGAWQEIAKGTSIGANRLLRLPANVKTTKVRLRITKSPVCVALSDFGLFALQE
ncbi:MAG: alpha-L-fucosidase [Acidobacteria bacterium]|nr:alpha-L-fucosidase [Acidobacteriota bacterium]